MTHLIGFLLLALSATAQHKPTIQITPFPSEGIVAPTASACGFDILLTPQPDRPNGSKIILFGDTGIATGPIFLTVKNLNTGKTLDLNLSGPGFLTFGLTTQDVVLTGQILISIPPIPTSVALAAGVPRVPLINGRIAFTADNQMTIMSIQSVSGNVQDLCQLLQ